MQGDVLSGNVYGRVERDRVKRAGLLLGSRQRDGSPTLAVLPILSSGTRTTSSPTIAAFASRGIGMPRLRVRDLGSHRPTRLQDRRD